MRYADTALQGVTIILHLPKLDSKGIDEEGIGGARYGGGNLRVEPVQQGLC